MFLLIRGFNGHIVSFSNEEVRHLVGDWTKCVYSLSPEAHDEFLRKTNVNDTSSSKRKNRSKSDSSVDDVVDVLTSLEGDCQCLWSVQARPEVSSKVRLFMSQNVIGGIL